MDAETKAAFTQASLFTTLSDDDVERLLKIAEERHAERDEFILHQNEPGDALYVIISGRVKVVLYGEDGKEVILSTLRAGDFFGEMALIDGRPRSASVVAVEPTHLVRLRRAPFLAFLREYPEMSLRMLEALSLRLRMADGKIGSLTLMDVYGRVARVLRELAMQEGKQAGSNVIIGHRPTHQELAAMAGTSRETVSRVLNDFARSGLMTIDGKRLILHDEFLDEM